jgi:iron complex outermembrane receptor protein
VEYFQFGSLSTYNTHTTQFSPRLRYVASTGVLSNEFVSGFDFFRSERERDASYAQDDATQHSEAFYFRNELKAGKARLALGARHERFRKQTVDPTPFNPSYQQSDSLNAWTLEGAYAFKPLLSVFAKLGQSYRIPNVDDEFQPTLLKPQTSHDKEIGFAIGDPDTRKLAVKLFQHRLRNEIMFYPDPIFQNVNLDPTKRQGVEVEASSRITSSIKVSALLQHVSAKFADGPNKGNEVVLVPSNTATLRLNWASGNGQTADVGIQWADSQRYGGDFSNTCNARIPAYATLDARYAMKFGAWEFAIAGDNLTNKDYFTQAYGDCKDGIYPDPGRAIRLTVRRDF